MVEILPLELRKLGLKEKEAQVYLAALELGHSSVQIIAQKAGISRPTTYEIIKSLKEKGLISESKQKGKRYFSAESPDRLLGLLRTQKRELEEKEREFIRIIAELRSRYYLSDKNEIKTYQGKNDLKILLDDFLATKSKKIYIFSNNNKVWPVNERESAYKKIKKRLGEIQIKELSLTKKTSPFPYLKRKFFEQKSFPFKETIIISDKVIILSPKKEGLLIENKTVVDLIKSFFLLIWQLS
jgi:sugar-specific transcriptional regulator TrmB